MNDAYQNFSQLETHESEGKDWAREYLRRSSAVLVMAPHGGWIEPFTTELAQAIAGSDLSFYTFRGLKSAGNHTLHITSHCFDEPLALQAVAEADTIVSVHGERTRDRAFVMVGGADAKLRGRLSSSLQGAGFQVEPPRERLEGQNPENICNRGRRGAGGQLELSEGLRQRLRREPRLLAAFVQAVRTVVLSRGLVENPRGAEK